jgi:hypothetical protein
MKTHYKILFLLLFFLILTACEESLTPEETRLEGNWTFAFEGDSNTLDTTFTLVRSGSSSLGDDSVRYTGSGMINGQPHSIELHDNTAIDRIVGEISLDSGSNDDIITLDQGLYLSATNTITGKYVGHTSGIYASYTTNDYTATGP